jgi:hypothetical protein
MSPHDKEIADAVYHAMMESQHRSDRSAQAQEFRVGVSDLGYCSERLRRFLDRQVPEETDMLDAFIGTWLGTGVEQAYKTVYPEAVIQAEVTLSLRGETNTYIIPGHPDIIHGNTVLDVKSSAGLNGPARHGFTDQQKKFQRHGYGYAAWEAGLLGDIGLDEVTVGNIWIDRTGDTECLLVRTEPLDLDVVDEAIRWLDDVVYAWQRQEEAQKEPAREVCQRTCGFYRQCRAFDTDVQGLITDPALLDAVEMHLEGSALKKKGEQFLKESRSELAGVSGSTGTHLVRWVHVVPTIAADGSKRAGYSRLQVQELK